VPRLRLNHLLESLFLVANDSYYPNQKTAHGRARTQGRNHLISVCIFTSHDSLPPANHN
jgi:hypothetical protein